MKQYHLLLLFPLFFWACNGSKQDSEFPRQGKGGIYYGGVFRMNETEGIRSLYPLNITDAYSHRITNQIYEGLVKLDQKDLSIIPCIAERWEINDSATSFTFYMRKGVKFHDDPCFPNGKGREVTANDFKYCFNKVCEADINNQGFWVFKGKVQGADEYFQSTVDGRPLPDGVSGIKIIDDYTVQINLKEPFASFLNLLVTPFCWVFAKEAFDKYGIDMREHCVGTGPFFLKTLKHGEAVILSRNTDYWGVDEYGNKLPYLEAIKFTFIPEKRAELLEFKKGQLDMVFQLPPEMYDEVIGELEQVSEELKPYDIQIVPSLSTQFYGFLHTNEVFNNKIVRQAFNYAIDRESICTYTLSGEGTPAFYGLIPPSFKDYEYQKITGYKYDPEKARILLAQAGYPDGKGFPKITLQLNSGGTINIRVAEVMQKQLKDNLGIEVSLNVIPWPQHLEALETGKALFWRMGWLADYNDPENFLNLFYSIHIPKKPDEKSYINSTRYSNPAFDSLLQAALRETDVKKRFEIYRQADQLIVDEAAVLLIYYDENTRLLQPYVKNFPQNPMELRDLGKVWLQPEEAKGAEGGQPGRRTARKKGA
ncbi:MAG: ABC transporter substrate-binding protein [Bacteroidetes bacterium]|nr:ABC transporter substrate-binding protein [Bacteroidota bacterium]